MSGSVTSRVKEMTWVIVAVVVSEMWVLSSSEIENRGFTGKWRGSVSFKVEKRSGSTEDIAENLKDSGG